MSVLRTKTPPASLVRKNSAVSGIFCIQFVGIAPHPFFPGFRGDDDGMSCPVVVFGHVLHRGSVTAQRSATGLTGAEMDPRTSNLDTLFADVLFGLLELLDLLHVGADFLGHMLCFL
jgi:hypothetical protein